jgi:hypothetical protein
MALEWHDAMRCQRSWQRRRKVLLAAGSSDAAVALVVQRAIRRARAYAGCRSLGRSASLDDLALIGRNDYDADPAKFYVGARNDRVVSTSGTTGTPITVRYDQAAWFESNHVTFARVARQVPELAGNLRAGKRAVVLITLKEREPFAVPMPLLGGGLFQRMVVGRSPREDEAIVMRLRGQPPVVLHGKPSYLLALAKADSGVGGAGRIAPGVILVSGENLFPEGRRLLGGWFACPVRDAYTSAEGGVLALECPYGRGLHVPRERILEVEGSDGALGAAGRGRIVMTNLTNWCTVLLRYRTDDWGTLSRGDCACGHGGQTLVDFSGREALTFSTPAGHVAVEPIAAAIRGVGVDHFQLARYDTGFVFRWAGEGLAAPTPGQESRLRAVLGKLLGGAPVSVERVTALTPPGGKVWRFRDYSSLRPQAPRT